MNNTEKLQHILRNAIKKSDGTVFYRPVINGALANAYIDGYKIILGLETNGERVEMWDITNVNFDCDIAFCSFEINDEEYLLDFVRDMSASEIMETLA